MPDLPSNLPSSIRAANQDDFADNVENALYDITDSYNTRCDSERQTLMLSTQAAEIPNLAQFGSAVLMINGTRNGQPAAIFALCKSDATQSGNVNELMQVAGTGNFENDRVSVTWPANSAPQIQATSAMLANILWRN